MLTVTRNEFKYYLSTLNADFLAHRLSLLLQTDVHNCEQLGYRVQSLYFDNQHHSSLSDKQAGVHNRQKFRLRIYNQNDENAKFEVKYKYNQQIKKESYSIRRAQAMEVVKGNYNALNKIAPPLYAKLIAEKYRPVVIVKYWRQAFIYPFFNVRITLDRHLSGDATQLNLFDEVDTALPVLMNGRQILEVKYDHHLPDFIKKAINEIPLERSAISKYTLARRYFKTEKWEDN